MADYSVGTGGASDEIAAYIEAQKLAKLEKQKQLADELSGRINLTPAAAMLQSIYGGSDALVKAASEQEKAAAKAEQDAQDQVDALSGLSTRGTASQPNTSSVEAAQIRSDAQKSNKELGVQQSTWKELNKKATALSDEAADFENKTAIFDDALSTGKMQTAMTVIEQLARGVGGMKGVLTDTDIARVIPETAEMKLAKIRQYISGEAPMPKNIADNMRELMTIARKRAKEKMSERTQKFKSFGKSAPFAEASGLSDMSQELESVANRLYDPAIHGEIGKKSPAVKAQSQPATDKNPFED
jgi:hypothetical protein